MATVGLQLYFVGRIALMAVAAPTSTAFQRSEVWRLMSQPAGLRWRQTWVPYNQIAEPLKRVAGERVLMRLDRLENVSFPRYLNGLLVPTLAPVEPQPTIGQPRA